MKNNEMLNCVKDLLDTIYTIHPNGAIIRKRNDADLQMRLDKIGENAFDPDRTIRRILKARGIIRVEEESK